MKNVKNILIVFVLLLMVTPEVQAQSTPQRPIRMAIAGMTHGHIAFILGRKDKGDFQLVGVYEPKFRPHGTGLLIERIWKYTVNRVTLWQIIIRI